MIREKLEVKEALERGRSFPWAMLRGFSRVTLGNTPPQTDAEELLEACFFSPEAEIRLWREDGTLRAAFLAEEAGDRVLEERRSIENPAFGRALWVRRIIDFDEDGQAYVAGTRLCGWEGGRDDG